jgi:hypothetical protein
VIRAARYSRPPSRPRRADGPAAFLRGFGARLRGSIAPEAVNSISAAIQEHEGYYSGSRSYRNNNPGNLRYVGQLGASSDPDGFAVFGSYAAGLQALKNQITLDATRGSDAAGRPVATVGDLITSWAPPSENDTGSYVAAVSAQTGYDPSAPLSSLGSGSSYSPAAGGFDLSSLRQPIDLSSVGLPSAVPLYAVLGVSLFAIAAFKN